MKLGWNCKIKIKDTNCHIEYSMDSKSGLEKIKTFNDNKLVGYNEQKHEPNNSNMKLYSEMFSSCLSDLEEEIESNFYSIPQKETLVEYITGKYTSFKLKIEEIERFLIPAYTRQKAKDHNFPDWWMQIAEIHKKYLIPLLERFEIKYRRFISVELIYGEKLNNIEVKDSENPRFNPVKVKNIYEVLKMYFSAEDQPQLKKLLESGTSLNKPILFMWHGKTLLDFFKQLMKGRIVTISVQADLEKWISKNFMFFHDGKAKNFTPKNSSKIISGNERAAKGNRLIDVQIGKKGTFKIVPLEIKNRK